MVRRQGSAPDARLSDLNLQELYVRESTPPDLALRMLTNSGATALPVIDADHHVVGWIPQQELIERMYRQQQRALTASKQASSFGSRWMERRSRNRR